jgi:hypothetical protein
MHGVAIDGLMMWILDGVMRDGFGPFGYYLF